MFRNRQSSLIFPGTKGRKESSLSFCIDRFGKWVPSNTSRQPEDFIGAKNRCEPVGGAPYRRPRNENTPPLSNPRILPRRVDKRRINYALKNFLRDGIKIMMMCASQSLLILILPFGLLCVQLVKNKGFKIRASFTQKTDINVDLIS